MRAAVHVRPKGCDWEVWREGAPKPFVLFDTSHEAEKLGRTEARRWKVVFVLHGKRGEVLKRDDYGAA